MDYRKFFDRQYLGAWDLVDAQGRPRDVTVEIERVVAGELVSEGNKKTRKPIIHLRGKEKRLAANVTNCRTIAGLYGTDVRQWVGKLITIYPTTTKFGRETVDCIRIRPSVPRGKADTSPTPAVDTRPPDRVDESQLEQQQQQQQREPGDESEVSHG